MDDPLTGGFGTLAVYLVLAAALVYGREGARSAATSSSRSEGRSPGDPAAEIAWLTAVGVTMAYPVLRAIPDVPAFALSWPGGVPGAPFVSALGFAFVVAGGLTLGTAFRSLGAFTTPRIELRPDHVLVRSGPYAFVRHPMYTAILLLSVGIALQFLATLLWLDVGAIVVLAYERARREEALFLASPRFGPAYAEYRRRTGRFLPRLRSGPAAFEAMSPGPGASAK